MSMHSSCFLRECKKHKESNEELTVGQVQVYIGQRSKEEQLAQSLFEHNSWEVLAFQAGSCFSFSKLILNSLEKVKFN